MILKTTLFIIILLISASAFPQDSLFSKQIITNKFDLTIYYGDKDSGFINSHKLFYSNKYIYEDCQLINSITDSSFYVHFNSKRDLILFKNINEISFKGTNYKGTGMFLGALGGLVSGITFSYIVYNSVADNKRSLNHILAMVIAVPTFTIGGMVIGWAIGSNTYERETYDISKYSPNGKKDKVLKIFFSKQINI